MKTRVFLTGSLLSLVVVTGVFGAEKKAASKAAAPAASAPSGTVTLDPATSVIRWEGKKVTGKHDGTVQLKSGQAQVQNGQLTGGAFDVDMTSIKNTDLTDAQYNNKLVTHLKSPDFFDVQKFPTASFKITAVEALPPAATKGTHQIAGDLTIKGTTKQVSFPATLRFDGKNASAKANVVIDRTLYDIRYGSGKFFQNLGDKMISDEFTLDLDLKGTIQ